MKTTLLVLGGIFLGSIAAAQDITETLPKLLQTPRQYTVVKAQSPITIDGKDDDPAWKSSPWMEPFIDIEGGPKKIPYDTKAKMAWDADYLYVYVQMEQPGIWASLKEQDQSIFQDHALEIFFDPDGDGQNYVEFQINAFEAVWDLIMAKAYRNGGTSLSSWDIKGLKKAVYINGTLNNPGDTDKYWGIELAFPVKSMPGAGRSSALSAGTVWRMNFSRVDWETQVIDGKYVRTKNDRGQNNQPKYTTWTSQGLVNLHAPEMFGYVQFVDTPTPANAIIPDVQKTKQTLWKYYYLQQDYKLKNKKYALSAEDLKRAYPAVSFADEAEIKMYATEFQFWLQSAVVSTGGTLALDHDGKFYDQRPLPQRNR